MKMKFLSSIVLGLVASLMVGCGSQNNIKTPDNAGNSQEASNYEAVKPVVGSQEAEASSKLHSVISVINGEEIELTSVHFAFDKYDLSSEMKDVNRKNAGKIDKVLKQNANVKVKLEGNSDEWGTDEYNQALGLKRAKSVKDALVSAGISEDSISITTLGESSPICEEKTPSCWKLNRRVDYKLLP